MAIEKKLIHFGKLADFETQLTAGNILDYSIVFIQDAKKIWTHGTYYDCSEAEDISSISWDDVENKPTFATVATSGSYNDLSDKPTIPSAVTESTVSGWGFTKNTGTITQIKANGTSVATSGVANIPAASTSAYGVTKLSSSTSSTSTTLAATPSAVKAAYDLANSKGNGTITGITMNGVSKGTSGVVNLGTVITAHQDISGKQDKLVSGTNIKTINGTSLLGSGNITIEGGSGGGSSAYSEVSHGTSDTTFALTPNVFHIWEEVASLTLTLGDETAGVANEFLFQFNSGETTTTLTLPDTLKWANDSVPTIEANKIYQISILKGLASVLVFDNTPAAVLITFTIAGTEYQADEGMTWEQWVLSIYNTSGFIIMMDNYVGLRGEMVATSDTTYVTKSNVIINDFAYILKYVM